jgi:hypothetical protein
MLRQLWRFSSSLNPGKSLLAAILLNADPQVATGGPPMGTAPRTNAVSRRSFASERLDE